MARKKKIETSEIQNNVPVEIVKPKKTSKTYHILAKLNDRVYEADTNDIAEAIRTLRPPLLKTSLSIKVTKNGKTIDRYLYLNDARRLFLNRITLEAFVRNLYF